MSSFTDRLKLAWNVLTNRENFSSHSQQYTKKEYYSGPTQNDVKTQDKLWTNLPSINPLALVPGGGNSSQQSELIRGTTGSWDPRGEHASVRNIQQITIPGALIDDRIVYAAQQRAGNRDLVGRQFIQI